jgi:hypothetical protein
MSLTQKQESFCLAYIETGNASEAYRRSYATVDMSPASVNREASNLLDNPKITARLGELRQRAEDKSLLTLEAHMNELQSLRDLAKQNGQYSAAIKAEELRGKLCKLYVDQREAPGKDAKPASPAEKTPGPPGEDHLDHITRRYRNALKVIEGDAAAKGDAI